MLAESWLLFCIVASFLASVAFGINAHFKANGILLSFWRSVFTTVALLPMVFFLKWPENISFYIFTALTATIGIISDMFMYKAAKDHGSGPCLRLLNLRIPLGVLIGWVLFPASWLVLWQQPVLLFGVLLAVTFCVIALFFMQKNPVGKVVIFAMLTPVTLYVMTDMLQKEAILFSPDLSGIYVFLFVMCAVMTVVSAIPCFFITKTFIEPKILKHGAIVSCIWLLLVAVKTAALIGIPNPGYFSIFIGLSAVWAMLYNKWKKIPDHASPVAGIFLVLGAVILAYLVSVASS